MPPRGEPFDRGDRGDRGVHCRLRGEAGNDEKSCGIICWEEDLTSWMILETFCADALLLRVKLCLSGWTGISSSCSGTKPPLNLSNTIYVTLIHRFWKANVSHCTQERRREASSYYWRIAAAREFSRQVIKRAPALRAIAAYQAKWRGPGTHLARALARNGRARRGSVRTIATIVIVSSTGLNVMLTVTEHFNDLSARAIVNLAPEIVPCAVACLGLLLRPVPAVKIYSTRVGYRTMVATIMFRDA